jgi:hypothetical protein
VQRVAGVRNKRRAYKILVGKSEVERAYEKPLLR